MASQAVENYAAKIDPDNHNIFASIAVQEAMTIIADKEAEEKKMKALKQQVEASNARLTAMGLEIKKYDARIEAHKVSMKEASAAKV